MLPLYCLRAEPPALLHLHAAVSRAALARQCQTEVSSHPGALPCSRGMVGALTAKTLDEKVDVNGTSFQQASSAVGYGGKSHEVGGLLSLVNLQECCKPHAHALLRNSMP
jgi:hypothetical protein